MSATFRPPKSGGTTNYSTEVALGFDVIKAAEVDLDLNTLYGTINVLDDANIRNGANIHGSKIAPGTLPPGQIQPGTITNTQISNTANIHGSKLASDTVTARELTLNAVIRQVTAASPAPNANIGAVELPLLTFPAVTLHAGSYVVLFGAWSTVLQVSTTGTGFPAFITRWKRNGVEFRKIFSQASIYSEPTALGFLPLAVPAIMDAPGAGVFTYTLTYQTGGTACQVYVPNEPNTGAVWLVELGGDP